MALTTGLQIDFVTYDPVFEEQSTGIHDNQRTELLYPAVNREGFAVHDGFMRAGDRRGLGVVVEAARVVEASLDAPDWRKPVWRHADGNVAEW